MPGSRTKIRGDWEDGKEWGGWETGKSCAVSAQPGVAKREPGRKGWIVSSQKPLGNLQQQGLCSACWLARRCFIALLGFHSNELKTLAR